jgi:hypothetical protein
MAYSDDPVKSRNSYIGFIKLISNYMDLCSITQRDLLSCNSADKS